MAEEKKKVILFSSESCGYGDTIIGYEALSTVLEILTRREKLPAAIVCINTATKLLSEDSPMLPRFKNLEERGVEILAGRMCVNELGLTGSLGAGKVTTLTDIIDFLLRDDVDIISL